MRSMTNLANRSSEHDHLIYFAHLPQELFDTGPFDDVDIMPLVVYFDRYDKIRVRDELIEPGKREKEAR